MQRDGRPKSVNRNPHPDHDCNVSTSLEGHDLDSDEWTLFQRKHRTKNKCKLHGKGKVGIRGDPKEPG